MCNFILRYSYIHMYNIIIYILIMQIRINLYKSEYEKAFNLSPFDCNSIRKCTTQNTDIHTNVHHHTTYIHIYSHIRTCTHHNLYGINICTRIICMQQQQQQSQFSADNRHSTHRFLGCLIFLYIFFFSCSTVFPPSCSSLVYYILYNIHIVYLIYTFAIRANEETALLVRLAALQSL